MSLDGSFVSPNDWYSSHNFDQRLVLIGNDYYTLAHGSAQGQIDPAFLGTRFRNRTRKGPGQDPGHSGTQVSSRGILQGMGS